MKRGENTPPILETLKIERPAFSQDNLNTTFSYEKPEKDIKIIAKNYAKENCNFDLKTWAYKTLPVLDWIPKYNWRETGPCDLIAGITVGIMHIPQGLGYALLAHVPPVVGIYMAFFPMIPYFFLGTSRHNSMGTFAVICLLVGKSVSTYAMNPELTHWVERDVNGTLTMVEEMYTEIEIGTAVTFFSAMWQLLLYLVHGGVVCTLLSDALVSSFITGAGMHIFTSQIKEVIGIPVGKHKGPFYMVRIYIDIFTNLANSTPEQRTTVYTALLISAISMTLLIITAYIIRPWLEKYTKIPFPAELILVVVGVIASTNLELPQNYGVKPIGIIPTGIPGPQVPYLNLMPILLVNAFVTAIVAYAVSMSMALILAEGEDYVVDPNQELLAQGIGNLVCSFFSCVTFGASLSRSMVLRGVGGKTQFTGLIASGLIVVVLLWIADFFEPLPRAILASIIIIALRKILVQIFDLPKFWKLSRMDGVVWVIVFVCVVIIDVDVGLGVGFCLSIGAVFMQGLKAYTCLLGNVPNTDLYLDINRYKAAREINGIKIVHYRGGVNFATRTNLRAEVVKLVQLDPKTENNRRQKMIRKINKPQNEEGITNPGFMGDGMTEITVPHSQVQQNSLSMHSIILDCSAMSSIDPAGAAQIKSMADEFGHVDIKVYLSGMSTPAYEKMKKCGFVEGEDCLPFFPTVFDAVHYIQNKDRDNVRI